MSQFDSGRVFINGGFRPAIVKQGHKWSQVAYIDGSRVRVKRVKGMVKVVPAYGDLKTLASAFLRRKNVLGLTMHISKGAKQLLQQARQQ